jgi:hypothetical protein
MKNQIKVICAGTLFAAMLVAGAGLLSCGRTEYDPIGPVSAATYHSPYHTPVSMIESSSPIVNHNLDAPIVMNDTFPTYAARISPVAVFVFNRVMRKQGTITVTKVTNPNAGPLAAPALSWSIGPDQSVLTVTLPTPLDTNSTYLFKMTASTFVDVDGNMLGRDGDNIGGESPDDDFVGSFHTRTLNYNDPNDPATGLKLVVDNVAPSFTQILYYEDTANALVTIVNNAVAIPVNATFWFRGTDQIVNADSSAVNSVVNLNWNALTGAFALYKLPDSSPVAITASPNADPVVTYTYTSLSIKPNSDLTPGVQYLMRVDLTKIVDAAGNKVVSNENSATRYFTRRFTAGNIRLDGSQVLTDGTPPTVSWYRNGTAYGQLSFSESVNLSGLTSDNITVLDANNHEIPAVLEIVNVWNGDIPFTQVTVTPDKASVAAYVHVKMFNITDLAGNVGIGEVQFNW